MCRSGGLPQQLVVMWPWKHNPSNKDLLERIESLERRFKLLLSDCDDFFDAIRRTENRLKRKRDTIAEQEAQQEGAEEVAPSPSPNGGFLSPKQKLIQQQILRRRAGLA